MSERSEDQDQQHIDADQQAMDDPLKALGRAAEVSARKDEVTTSALLSLRRSRIYMAILAAIAVAGISYGAWQAHDARGLAADTNARGVHNAQVLVCMADSEQSLAQDVHTLIQSKAKAPATAYKIPADCALVP